MDLDRLRLAWRLTRDDAAYRKADRAISRSIENMRWLRYAHRPSIPLGIDDEHIEGALHHLEQCRRQLPKPNSLAATLKTFIEHVRAPAQSVNEALWSAAPWRRPHHPAAADLAAETTPGSFGAVALRPQQKDSG